MKIKNSLSTYLEQAMVLTGNSLETINKVSDAVTSSEDSVKLVLTDPKDPNNTVEYIIPSFGYLKSEIDRLSASIKTMTNITDGAGSRIRLSDGTYRKIIASKVPSEAPTITSVDHITSFNFKSNWFFEDLLNPSLYITWDMSNQISPETERVMIQRYLLKCDTQSKIDVFNNELKGRNDINYKEFLTILLNNRIKYTVDDEVKDLPPRSKRYYGTFSVLRIVSEKDLYGNTVKRYILDSLEFSDVKTGFENTRLLNVGDFVEVNSDPTTTRFEVIYVDSAENKIGLKCVEGCEGIRIGADVLKISASQDTKVAADIPIGFNEREVIFVKAIDPDSNIPSTKWSPGVAFYSNELTYVDDSGVTQTLQKFYQRNVIDFGQVLLSYANDYYPSIREAIKPNTPVLNYSVGSGDFRIVQINTQLTEETDTATFRSLISDKAKVQSELDNIANEISKQKELIQTTKFVSTEEKLNAQKKLDSLIANQVTLSSNYTSIVNNIKSKYESSITSDPKYRVRGFWDIPDSKISASSGEQKIIQFKIRYRYLSESGNTNKEEEFYYTSGNASVIGRFSNWIETETKMRPRVKTDKGWVWEDIDTADPDAVNINQLDIPINPGEQVEIQVKSVSEAGWPSNPVESDWSDPIVIAFSDFAELQVDNIRELVEQNRVDAAVANVAQMFTGATEHISTSFVTNDNYFAHSAENITSGFLSPEQTPITLYDKLQELQNQLNMITAQIEGAVGDLNVILVDSSDEEKLYTLKEGETNYINAGDYLSALKAKGINTPAGEIVTKVFYIDISTDAQNGLFLLSKLSGDRFTMCSSTIRDKSGNEVTTDVNGGNCYSYYDNVIIPTTTSGSYYYEQGRYDLVPINLTNPEVIDFHIGSPSMYQSAQCRGQFIYSRFRNIGDTFDMYANCSKDTEETIPQFKYDALFVKSEIPYGDDTSGDYSYISDSGVGNSDVIILNNSEAYNIIQEYISITGSELRLEETQNGDYKLKDGDRPVDLTKDNLTSMKLILNRLPKNWGKKENATIKKISDKKTIIRVANLENIVDTTNMNLIKTLRDRLSTTMIEDNISYSVDPKIQSAYGYADLGKIYKNSLLPFDSDPTYFTTHKIGYEEKDKRAIGKETCNSYLFLSPVNHKEIQVNGDSLGSNRKLQSEDSLRVPIIYQYRMTDGDGKIFGKYTPSQLPTAKKNEKYANIIGIDIWTDVNAFIPKQYDIIVYSSYDSSVETNTNRVTTSSTQRLVNAGTKIAKNLEKMIDSSANVKLKTGKIQTLLDTKVLKK